MSRRTTLLVALAIAGCAHPQRPASPPPEGFVEAADGARLYFRRMGSGGPVVIVPGGIMLEAPLALLARSRTVVFYDPRNRGRSSAVEDLARVNVQADVDDLEAVRRHLGAEQISLVGWSYLGRVVALYARAHPERVDRVVQIGAVDPGLGTPYPPELVEPHAGWPADLLALEAEVARLRKEGRDRDDPAGFCATFWAFMGRLVVYRTPAPTYLESCQWPREWPASLDGHFKALFGSLAGAPLTPASLVPVAAPALVIHGRHDRQVPLGAGREWALTWRQARLITIDEGAHAPFLDDPSTVADIDQFLAGTWPRRAEEVRTLVP